ncbi:hypothetical protein P3T76_009970 [Phytophthora citrophthora]|uniref:SWIM-type domain-containing protein n=1 Tax=Phytophthora citrophthora TaxID=4793 RepID=A0AAD9LIS0_9STRA|nr:hypothetical protein P3T76_009970 [Phytophthora citrophthora]
MEAYVRSIVPENWALYPYVNKVKLYKWRTTNFVESVNGQALPARELFPAEFFAHYMETFMETKYFRCETALICQTKGQVTTEYAEKKYAEERTHAGFPSVKMSSSTQRYGYDTRSTVAVRRFVNIAVKTCECVFTHQLGIPCRHTIAVLTTINKAEAEYDVTEYCR